jgi:hypothetical protein
LQATISFTDEYCLNDFYATASRHTAAAHAVKSLYIHFDFRLSAIGAARALFPLLVNLEDLELYLVGLSRVAWMRLLGSIQFQNLATISTNAPHDIICLMCRSHKLLHITLTESCPTASTCPLASSVLPSLASVCAPASCVAAIVHGNPVEKVAVTDFGDPDVHSFCSMVGGFAFGTASITSLHLEFNPIHRDVLRRLAGVVPNLGALKLVEKLDATQVRLDAMSRSYPQQHLQDAHHDLDRPWKHATQWGTDLMQFHHLHRLLLRSSAAVPDDAEDQEQESNLVNTWAGGSSTTISPVHPSLRYITLWTSVHSPQEKLHYWQRLYSKRWAMVGNVVPPTWDGFI